MTYSIVARDKETGELGVAVQSHYFQVGPTVPWAIAGVGAVATQSRVNVSYGPLGLEYLNAGYTAEQTLKALTSADSTPDIRSAPSWTLPAMGRRIPAPSASRPPVMSSVRASAARPT